MADEMNTCEYIWNHELAMRRLLTMLRNGQAYCTDTECVDPPGSMPSNVIPSAGSDGSIGGGDFSGSDFLFTFVIIVLAVLLYMLRPCAQRRSDNGAVQDKPSPRNNNDNGNGRGGNGGSLPTH